MSSSDDERQTSRKVKPENKKAKVDTSNWPLLLKVF
jgi:hypothetical protein